MSQAQLANGRTLLEQLLMAPSGQLFSYWKRISFGFASSDAVAGIAADAAAAGVAAAGVACCCCCVAACSCIC